MFKKLIDLTHPLDWSVPTWNGGCGFHAEIKMDYPQGLRVLSYKMHAGIGTHMDAPSHFFQEGKHIADISLQELFVPLVILDVSKEAHADFLIGPKELLAFEKRHGKIPKGSAVIANTGWAKKWRDTAAYRNPDAQGRMHFPGFQGEGAEFLLERGIVGVGIDTLSPDGTNQGFPVHEAILGNGKYILENLTQLEEVPPLGAYLIALPLKIREGTESAVRAVAVIS